MAEAAQSGIKPVTLELGGKRTLRKNIAEADAEVALSGLQHTERGLALQTARQAPARP